MSLQVSPVPDVPEETAYSDELFTSVFAVRGQPAEAPWRLALVSVMQFMEGLSDRQAADAVRARLDWKYALSLPLPPAPVDGCRHQRLADG